jgi:hypothetical protein
MALIKLQAMPADHTSSKCRKIHIHTKMAYVFEDPATVQNYWNKDRKLNSAALATA